MQKPKALPHLTLLKKPTCRASETFAQVALRGLTLKRLTGSMTNGAPMARRLHRIALGGSPVKAAVYPREQFVAHPRCSPASTRAQSNFDFSAGAHYEAHSDHWHPAERPRSHRFAAAQTCRRTDTERRRRCSVTPVSRRLWMSMFRKFREVLSGQSMRVRRLSWRLGRKKTQNRLSYWAPTGSSPKINRL